MKAIGIVASARRLGNSEVLVKEALDGAREAGAEVGLIRLTDLKILPCDGCMACVFSRQPCHLGDDVPWLFRQMTEADGLVVGAPTYVLGPAGLVKMVLDRYLMLGHEIRQLGSRGRKGVSISVAGLPGWNPFGPGLLNLLLMAMQARPVGWMQAYAPGPGEVLLEPDLVEKARALGRLLVSAPAAEMPRPEAARPALLEGGAYACPFCGSQALRLTEQGLECPLCAARAPFEGLVPGAFTPPGPHGHRWDPVPAQEHIDGWVMSTRDRFLAKRDAIRPLRPHYREMDAWWLKPPQSESPRAIPVANPRGRSPREIPPSHGNAHAEGLNQLRR